MYNWRIWQYLVRWMLWKISVLWQPTIFISFAPICFLTGLRITSVVYSTELSMILLYALGLSVPIGMMVHLAVLHVKMTITAMQHLHTVWNHEKPLSVFQSESSDFIRRWCATSGLQSCSCYWTSLDATILWNVLFILRPGLVSLLLENTNK